MNIRVPIQQGELTLEAQLNYTEREDGQCEVGVLHSGERLSALAGDFFEALLAVRVQLESRGLLLGVRGATRDVWPSAMSRQMGSGLQAYRMALGRQAFSADLVNIFETSSDVVPATIRTQTEYRDAWFNSLGGESNGAAV